MIKNKSKFNKKLMNKKKPVEKCSRGQKFCKNPSCREALHIHRHICVKCSFINDKPKFTT